jgi:hypothetical protein
MAKCHVCDKETEDRFLFNRFSFGAHVGPRPVQLKGEWGDDKNKGVAICHRRCASLLKTFGRSLEESLSKKPQSIM